MEFLSDLFRLISIVESSRVGRRIQSKWLIRLVHLDFVEIFREKFIPIYI